MIGASLANINNTNQLGIYNLLHREGLKKGGQWVLKNGLASKSLYHFLGGGFYLQKKGQHDLPDLPLHCPTLGLCR